MTLPPCQKRIVGAQFVEKEVTSDGGVLLLREIDRKISLTAELEKIIPDLRDQSMITHSLISMLKQRIYGDEVHGHQENRHFHGYYLCYCFLPLHVFCGNQLLISYLRPSNIDGTKHEWAILLLLVKRIRKSWPNVKIIFRGDSGFCRDLISKHLNK